MLSKIKNFRGKISATILSAFAVMSVVIMSCLTCFAAEESSSTVDLSATLSSSFDSIKNDIFGYIALALPTALVIAGAFFGIKKSVVFFKSTAK